MVSFAHPCAWRLLAFCAACAASAPLARAQDLRSPHEKADQICANHGPGFLAGSGPGHCVKVLERMRVEPGGRRNLSSFDAPMVYAPQQDAPLRARVRLNGGFGGSAQR
jgi:hypothetical protein